MSPTMTEGGIAGWKKEEGESFAAGDVLLEIETDKATIDVEAQDDGVMGKILYKAGDSKIPVGQVIAVLAEEGDDLSALEIPTDVSPPSASSSTPPTAGTTPEEKPPQTQKESSSPKSGEPSQNRQNEPQAGVKTEEKAAKIKSDGVPTDVGAHSKDLHTSASTRPLFPSVMRLLAEANMSADKIAAIKGTGRNGMLTKGDVLAALGKIKDHRGSMKGVEKTSYAIKSSAGYGDNGTSSEAGQGKKADAAPSKPLTGIELRQAILAGLEKASAPVRPITSATSSLTASSTFEHEFESLFASYPSLLAVDRQPKGVTVPDLGLLASEMNERVPETKKDEWEGLF